MTPLEDRLLEIADDHDRRASRLSDRKNIASERQASLVIRAALLSIGVLRTERDRLREALGTAPCPRPIQPATDGYGYTTTADCVNCGNCGCDQGAALAPGGSSNE
jgi:hypothetical protein